MQAMLTNLPQGPGSFIAAMECVLKGGKAWRPTWTRYKCAYVSKRPQSIRNRVDYDPNYEWVALYTHGPNSKQWTHYRVTLNDLEATDCVCEEVG